MKKIALYSLIATIGLFSSFSQARSIRIECGLYGPPDPHRSTAPYIALYKNRDMKTYRILFFQFQVFHFEDDINMSSSSIEPVSNWPQLSAVLNHKSDEQNMTTSMQINKPHWEEEHKYDPGVFEFLTTGTLNTDVFPDFKDIPLECYGLYKR